MYQETAQTCLSTEDILAIQNLYARHFYALDGRNYPNGGDPAANWATTFTPNGTFSITRANGEILLEVTGLQDLIRAYKTFPDVQTTRHWINNLIVEPDTEGARGGCYIIAMNIKKNPATIIRTGVYQDWLVKLGRDWKFQSRGLILDPNSLAG